MYEVPRLRLNVDIDAFHQRIDTDRRHNKFSRHSDYYFIATTVTYRTLRAPHLKNGVAVVCIVAFALCFRFLADLR
jgi:hypothetical protein